MKKIAFAALSLVFASSAAWAEGGALQGIERMAKKDRAVLEHAVQVDKVDHPAAFKDVADIRAHVSEFDRTKRGPHAVISPYLVSLGAGAVMPLLEIIALKADKHEDLSPKAWTDWRASVLEAVGKLRDPRALPLLVAVLEGPETESLVVAAAAGALARANTDDVASRLIRVADASSEKRRAVLSAMGECRRPKVAEYLATLLPKAGDDLARVILRSLGLVGSTWAWDTIGGATSLDGDATRRIAARALVDAYRRNSGELRERAAVALTMVEHRDTPALIEAAKQGADVPDVRALDTLLVRLGKHSLR